MVVLHQNPQQTRQVVHFAFAHSRKERENIVPLGQTSFKVLIAQTRAFFFQFLFQNTALHLAATGGHPDVVTLLLSSDKQEILMNKKNQNVLDAAMEAEQKKVLLAIVSHKR